MVRHGLAGFAAALAAPQLLGCDGDGDPDAGFDAGGGTDAGPGVDAGTGEFPVRTVPDRPALRSLIGDIGPLEAPDALGLALPAGFTARIVATTSQTVAPSGYVWHTAPDGGATFITEDSGWIYVSNSEVPLVGGVGALRFSPSGELIDAYRILDETNINCAGGLTPWHTWLSCEETDRGQVYECDPWGEHPAVLRPALGTFKHEAAAVDPASGYLYLSEDQGDGGFYRFIPAGMTSAGFPDLTAGELQIAQLDGENVTWLTVPDPQLEGDTPTREQVDSTPFDGGEGIWFHANVVYMTTKGDNRLWAYDVVAETMTILYDDDTSATPILSGVDNVTVSCCGDVLVAEDGGDMQICVVLPSGEVRALVQISGQDGSEITGPAFDPSGTRLYFSSQRGIDGAGITYEVTGPFHEPA